jgi:hypothetical protein
MDFALHVQLVLLTYHLTILALLTHAHQVSTLFIAQTHVGVVMLHA